MEPQQIQIKHISQEAVLTSIINERDSIILTLVEQLGSLQQENEKLKKEKAEGEKSKKDKKEPAKQ